MSEHLRPTEEKKEGGFLGTLMAIGGSDANEFVAASPMTVANFGLIDEWGTGDALMGTPDEEDYIDQSLEILGVDAILVINDVGYSFSCKVCVNNTGAASTGSAFHATLVGKDSF